MLTPAKPADEDERLDALKSMGILDTLPEERFDRYTRLAKRLFKVPIALVSLVDSDRQWFKSRQGLEATQTPRDISFCGHAIGSSETLVVENALFDDRFVDNPLVLGDPNIRFYAGHPVQGPAGHRLGTLCIIDREPRTLDGDDAEALRDIADLVSAELSALLMATVDSLTGISNRRGFDTLVRQALAACQRRHQTATLIAVDMDGFKSINDTLGHDVGDAALREAAALMLDAFRESDVVARLGGDEFGALLVDADLDGARLALARLRELAAARNSDPSAQYALRFSGGVASYDPNGPSSLEELLKRADVDMYDDKRRRRGVR